MTSKRDKKIIDRAISDYRVSTINQPEVRAQKYEMATIDKVAIVVGAVGLAACAYRAYKGDTNGMIDDLWSGAKTGAMYGAAGGAILGVGAGAIIGSRYGSTATGAIVGATTLALSGAIYGGAIGGSIGGSGFYDSFSVNNDDLV